MSKKLYPIEDGWLHMKLTMNSAEPLGDKGIANVKDLCTGKDPDAYDFGIFEQHGKVVKVVLRKKQAVAA